MVNSELRAIARSIAAKHHAQLEVASASEEGTTVRVKIAILRKVPYPSQYFDLQGEFTKAE